MNDASLTAIQTGAFVIVGGASLRFLAREAAPVARSILAAGLAAGTCMHVVALLEHGLVGSPDQPVAFNAFWASLTLLDPLGALLLNVRPRAGILLTLAIMLADVSVNVRAFGRVGLLSSASWHLWFQIVFALYALGVAPRIWASGAAAR